MIRPVISIAIPYYDGAHTIAGALASVAHQSEPADEVLVVDDASPSPYQPAERSELTTRMIRNPAPAGLYPNHNVAWAESSGDWVLILHQDDELHPRCVEHYRRLVETIPAATELGFAMSSHHAFARGLPISMLIPAPESLVHGLRVGGVTPSGSLFQRQALEACGGFSREATNVLAEDWVLRLAAAGYGFAAIDLETTPGRSNGRFDDMVRRGITHRSAKITYAELFDGSRDRELLQPVEADLPRWSDEEIATLLMKLAQAGRFDLVQRLERHAAGRVGRIRRCGPYRHVTARRILRGFYWPLLHLMKRAGYRGSR